MHERVQTDQGSMPSDTRSVDIGRIIPGARGHPSARPVGFRPAAATHGSRRRFDEILDILRAIDEEPPDANGLARLLDGIAVRLQADQAVLILRDPLTEKLDCVLYNHDAKACKSYADYYHLVDPTHLGDQLVRGPSPLNGEPRQMVSDLRDRIDYADLLSTEFYNDFFKPADIHYDLLTAVSANSARAALCLFRSRRSRPFSDREADIMEVAAPFLASQVKRVLDADLAALAEATADKGVIICDSEGRVLHCNSLAQGLCRGLLGPRHAPVPLLHDGPGHGSQLAHVPKERGGGACESSTLHLDDLTSTLGPDIVVREVGLDITAAARMFILESRLGLIPLMEESLRERFALSKREIEVLRLMMDGATNKEIASRLFITERTVKWHMQRIADKVGVRTRTAIAHVVNGAL